MTQLEELLKEMEERANAATRGPWRLEFDSNARIRCSEFSRRDPSWRDWIASTNEFPVVGQDSKNAEFIAHARVDVPRLIKAVKVLSEASRSIESMPIGDSVGVIHNPKAWATWAQRVLAEALSEATKILGGE